MKPLTKADQVAMSPTLALQQLTEGNQRFRENRRLERDLQAEVRATSAGQYPFAAVLSCIDSRASAEIVFDQGLGAIFSARLAGNVVNEDVLGSIEFSCKAAGAKLVVVLGHTHCGAVKGACDGVQLGNLTNMLAKIQPALAATPEPADPAQRNSANAAFVDEVARKNVALAVESIREHSPVLRELEDSGAIEIVGAMYDVETGEVEFWT